MNPALAAPPRVRRNATFLALARRYARRRVRRELDGLFQAGLEETARLAQRRPLILAATHVAWWDSFALVIADEALGTEAYALMDARNLAALPFFGWLGCVPLRRDGGDQAQADLASAATLLDRPGRTLWMFPQGRQRPAHLRPLGLRPGVATLARQSRADVVPVALNYLFAEHHSPRAAMVFGAPIRPDAPDLMGALERELVAGLGRIDAFIDGRAAHGDLTPLVRSRSVRTDRGAGAGLLTTLAAGDP